MVFQVGCGRQASLRVHACAPPPLSQRLSSLLERVGAVAQAEPWIVMTRQAQECARLSACAAGNRRLARSTLVALGEWGGGV